MANFVPVPDFRNVNIKKIYQQPWESNARSAKREKSSREELEKEKYFMVVLAGQIAISLCGTDQPESYARNAARF